MTTNQDNKHILGLGPQSNIITDDGEELDMVSRYLVPTPGTLRYVERPEHNEACEFVKVVRVLQQYLYSTEDSCFGWYDIPLAEGES